MYNSDICALRWLHNILNVYFDQNISVEYSRISDVTRVKIKCVVVE